MVHDKTEGENGGNGTERTLAMGIEVSGLFGLILLVLDVWAIVKTLQSGAGTGSKVVWVVVILLLPLLGFIVWLLFGPGSSEAA